MSLFTLEMAKSNFLQIMDFMLRRLAFLIVLFMLMCLLFLMWSTNNHIKSMYELQVANSMSINEQTVGMYQELLDITERSHQIKQELSESLVVVNNNIIELKAAIKDNKELANHLTVTFNNAREKQALTIKKELDRLSAEVLTIKSSMKSLENSVLMEVQLLRKDHDLQKNIKSSEKTKKT